MSDEREIETSGESLHSYEVEIIPSLYTWDTLQALIIHQSSEDESGQMVLINTHDQTVEPKFLDLDGTKHLTEEQLENRSRILGKKMKDWDRVKVKFLERRSFENFLIYIATLPTIFEW